MALHVDDLFRAVKSGNLDKVHDLLEDGANANTSFGLQGTALCAAIQNNHYEIAQYLIDSGCDVNARDIDGEPPLCLAIRKGRADIVQCIIESSGCDLNKTDPVSLNPPICVAVTHGTAAMAKLLINAGCDVSKQGKDYNTAWHLAVVHEKTEFIEELLRARTGDVNMWNKSGKSPLHIAAELENTLMLETLLTKCPIMKDRVPNEIGTETESLPLTKGLDLDRHIMFDGNTPLHVAIYHKNMKAVDVLIKAGCDIHLQNGNSQTPLFVACKYNLPALVAKLIDYDANPDTPAVHVKGYHVRNKRAVETPLHVAIRLGNLTMVKYLVEAGAQLNQPVSGNYPLIQALLENKPDIVQYLLDRGRGRGLDLSTVDGSSGQNALGVVVCCSKVREFSQKLINLGCSVHGLHDGRLPLEYALEFECTEAVEVFIDNGADINTKFSGLNLLQHCITEGLSEDLLHVLLFFGADINSRTPDGESIVRLAMENSDSQMIRYLIASGYNLSQDAFVLNYNDSRVKGTVGSPKSKMHSNHKSKDDEDEDEDGSNCSDVSSVDSQAEMYGWLSEHASKPIRLLTQCRTAIRQYFVTNHISMKSMTLLPLPRKTKDFLMLKTLFEEIQRL